MLKIKIVGIDVMKINRENFIKNLQLNEEQEAILRLENCNVLVNAGAGSGKTKVLTDRIIYRLIFDEASLDRLLVVTFTKAAANQMKDKIYEKLMKYKRFFEKENSEILSKVNKAVNDINLSEIMTIDAFCNKIVRNYYLLLDIEPNFRIMDSKEEKVLSAEVMDDIFEEIYQLIDGDEERKILDNIDNFDNFKQKLKELLDNFCLNESDDELKNIIVELKRKADNYQDGYKWLQNNINTDEIAESYIQKITNSIKKVESVNEIVELMEKNKKKGSTYNKLADLKKSISEIDSNICIGNKLLLYQRIINEKKLSGLKEPAIAKNDDPEIINDIKKRFKTFKSGLQELKDEAIYNIGDNGIEDIIKKEKMGIKRYVPILNFLIKLYSDELFKRKQDRNSYTFSDIQRFAINLLYDGEEVSDIAKELKKHYIDIYVDEYQDSNFIQEKILTALSNSKNMFMVGDMKQSIYRFRGAEPELFNKKYDSYSDRYDAMGENMGVRMNMSTNYRSSNIVLNDVNNIFNNIMKKEIGGIDFDKSHELRVAEHNLFPVDIMQNEYVEIPAKKQKDENELKNEEREIIYVINRINDLINNGVIYYKENEEIKSKPVNYRDINILFSRKTHLDTYIKYLDEANIPYHTVSRTGFFDTREVNFIVSFLKLVDNPYQDIEIVGLLRSSIFGFTDEDLLFLSKYKQDNKYNNFYDAIVRIIDSNNLHAKINKKLKYFFDEINHLRDVHIYSDIYEMLSYMYDRYSIYSIFGVLSNGETRRANLELLLKLADDFLNIGETSIHSFIAYIEELKSKKEDIDSARLDVCEDAVNLQTIHVSKGLEAEFVFIVGSNYGANNSKKSSVEIYDKYGYIFSEYDAEQRILKHPSMIGRYLRSKIKMDEAGEALRVLYVALTRAKQKYIVVNTVSKTSKPIDEGIVEYMKNDAIKSFNIYTLLRFNKNLNYIIPDEKDYSKFEIAKIKTVKKSNFNKIEEKVRNFIKNIQPYAKKNSIIPKTVSVSELKRIRNDVKPYIEAELSDKDKYKGHGTEYGVAFHNVMKYIDFTDVESTIEVLIERFFKNLKNKPKKEVFLNFFDTQIGKRAVAAAKVHNIFKEEKFRNVYNRQSVRGMIDLFFIENGEVILLDYKTDAYKSEKKFIESYELQIKAYADVLEKVWGKKVREAYIYSFSLNKNILIIDNRNNDVQ